MPRKTTRKQKKGSRKKKSSKKGKKLSFSPAVKSILKKYTRSKSLPQGGRLMRGDFRKRVNVGDMKIRSFNAPVSIGSMVNNSVGEFKPIVLQHTEYLQQVTSTISFTPVVYEIQPALTDDFPWLGNIAGNFEQYMFMHLEWMYIPACASTTVGKVYMATQYDAGDSNFTTPEQILNYTGASSGNAWLQLKHLTRKRGAQMNNYFTRTGAVPSGQAISEYDYGKFTIATFGFVGSGTYIGDLMVRYTIKLIKPKIPPAVSGGYIYSVPITAGTGTSSTPFGGGTATAPTWAQTGTVVQSSTSTFTFADVGYWLFRYIGPTTWNSGAMSFSSGESAVIDADGTAGASGAPSLFNFLFFIGKAYTILTYGMSGAGPTLTGNNYQFSTVPYQSISTSLFGTTVVTRKCAIALKNLHRWSDAEMALMSITDDDVALEYHSDGRTFLRQEGKENVIYLPPKIQNPKRIPIYVRDDRKLEVDDEEIYEPEVSNSVSVTPTEPVVVIRSKSPARVLPK